MERLSYFDFDLLIERAQDHYRARVLQSPAGQASAEFALPFTDQDLEILMLRVGRPRRGVRRIESPEMQAAKQFGGKLFDAVFASDVRGALRSSVDAVNREGAGLRVRLRLSDTPELVDLPWEFLYNASLNRFLALSNKTPLVRYIELPETPRPLKIAPPLRVLVMISSPRDYEPLDVEREWQKLNDALRELVASNAVTLERLDAATLGTLRRRLRQGQYHVLHFVGHGGFDPQQQDGLLILEDEQGRGKRTSGQYLATVLTDHDTLRLVVLNACEGARTARTDPFAGVAQSLVQQGIPAVIAMQFEITDEASITFAHEFYAALSDGYPVDAALSGARSAIFTDVNDLEWGTPVLYLRAPDGMIFAPLSEQERAEVERTRRADQERLAQAQRAREQQQQIATLYLAAQNSFAQNDFDGAEKSLAALLALDATNADARVLQTQIQSAREQMSKEQAVNTRAAQPTTTVAPTALPERGLAKTESPPSPLPARNRMLILGGALAVLLILLLGGALALGVFNPRPATPTPPRIETFVPPTVPEKAGAGAPGTGCVNDVHWVDASYPPAGTLVEPGQVIEVYLTIANTGTCAWEGKHQLALTSGGTLHFTSDPVLAAPGAQTEIRLLITAPSEPGSYSGGWRLADPDGRPFGDPLFSYSFLVTAPTLALPGLTPTPSPALPTHVPTPTLIPVERPTGGKLVFLGGVRGSNEVALLVYDLAQESLTRIPFDTSRFQDRFFNAPTLSHDGRRLAFVGLMPGSKFRIVTMNIDGSNLRVLNPDGNYSDQAPAWSPDDMQLAFATNRDGNFEIYAMDASGANARRLTKTLSESTNPAWSPDGSRIVFADSATGNLGLYTISADGQGTTQPIVSDSQSEATDPVWSPDGTLVAYTARSRLRDWTVVRVYDMASQHITSLPCPAQKFCTTPTWSPDGEYIAFVVTDSHAEQNGDLYYTHPSSEYAPQRLTTSVRANIFRPSWSR